jgi:flavorubredoxin
VLDPARLRWVGFSHFEADECGALDEWLTVAPRAEPLCGLVAASVSVNDVAARPARALADGEAVATGRRRFRFLATPHVPHNWEAGLLFEETTATLFCSDLLAHTGDVEPLTTGDVVGRARRMILEVEAGPFAGVYPYTPRTEPALRRLAALAPTRLALMHGSTFEGDGAAALRALGAALRETVGPREDAR